MLTLLHLAIAASAKAILIRITAERVISMESWSQVLEASHTATEEKGDKSLQSWGLRHAKRKPLVALLPGSKQREPEFLRPWYLATE